MTAMKAAPLLPENNDGCSYLYISLCDPTPYSFILRIARACHLLLVFPAESLQVPFGEKRRLTHIPPELQARRKSRTACASLLDHKILAEFALVCAKSVTAPKE